MANRYHKITFLLIVFIGIISSGKAQTPDTTNLPYKISPSSANPYDNSVKSSNINLKDPENVTTEVEYDEETNQYIIRQKVGNVDYAPPYTMSFDEYHNYDIHKQLKSQWRKRYKEETFEKQSSIIPKINIGGEAFETIFGSSTIDIKPQGSAKLQFGLKHTKNENPSQPVELQKSTTFDFKEDIQMNVTGKIGDNLEMKISYNTESSFDFENTMNLRYQGKEDDIIQKIEAGDVSLPLNTSLISGSQSLFGILTELKFGKLYISSVFSQQKGETKSITVEGGAQKSEYKLKAVDYDKNRHFFLAQYFRENYDKALENLPAVSGPITINKVEVWVTNTTRSTDNARNIIAFLDLGEEKANRTIYGRVEHSIYNPQYAVPSARYTFPDNAANTLYDKVIQLPDIRKIDLASKALIDDGLKAGREFEKVEYARKLNSNEFTFDSKLGYVSLNYALNSDEVLAVAFEYTVGGQGEVYQVGEFSKDGDETLVLKMLKGTNFNPRFPNWHLMMKNIYSLGAYQVNKEDFVMEVEYYDDETGTTLFTLPNRKGVDGLNSDVKDVKFLRMMNLDNLNSNLDYTELGDGVFDFINNVTIDASRGRVIFPVLEPFGGFLKEQINNHNLSDLYVFSELYDSTQFKAEQITSKNKFYLEGTYKSAGGSDIYLNAFNIPEGSVKVTAGGIVLQENVDYTVDYNMGRVKIVNESFLASGTPIKISLESNSMFSMQSKTLMGTHLDYRFNDDFNLGATIMHLTERPMTEKVGIGEEPISNTIWGLNGSYRTDVPFLTKVVDFIPLIETKEMSSLTLEGEFAQLKPGHNKAISAKGEAFIDDFEGSESSIDLRNRNGWVLASIPQMFPESKEVNTYRVGANRAKLAWYQIDPLFFRNGSPVSKALQENLKVYRVDERDIYPNKDTKLGQSTEISTLDLAYFPNQRGPYNYNTSRLNSEGKLINPQESWAGIMRELSTNDFEAQNVEYIEFWMMDPFVEEDSLAQGGKLYINLGNVSEDIVKDGRKSYEHGMPTDQTGGYDETMLARVPSVQTSKTGFVNEGALRGMQDIGLDGLSSAINETGSSQEQLFFANYLTQVSAIVSNDSVLKAIYNDPSNDNYAYFQGDQYNNDYTTIIDRYLNYNNHEGNTPVIGNSNSAYNPTGQQYPDVEDINGDFTLSESEAYFQYEIDISKEALAGGSKYITDVRTVSKTFEQTGNKTVKWYQFKIPISEFNDRVNDISDFKSIRFMRMFMTDWENPIVLRFAKLELVRGEWRKFDYAIKAPDETLNQNEGYDPTIIPFSISTINIEENGKREPVNYVLPNGVDRQQDPSNPQLSELNEQAMVLKVDELEDGYSKAIYKNINMDMRDYGHLRMYIHAEARQNELSLSDNDVTCFVRVGSDFTDNYYEYEVPLKVTPWGNYSDDANGRGTVWPSANYMDMEFTQLTDLKQERNAKMRQTNPTASLLVPYSEIKNQDIEGVKVTRKITIKGNPNLAQAVTIMIGIRNPHQKHNDFNKDNGEIKAAEIWVNELRLTDFKEDGGWAATGRMTMRLADFGSVSVAGSTTQAGFGSIEQTAQERPKEEVNQVDVAANFELGKFLPKESNVRIPMYVGYSRTAINPEYNPLDQDVFMDDALNDPNLSSSEKAELKSITQDLTVRKSVNFTNVGIGQKAGTKAKFYSPSNISASYAYSKTEHHDISTKANTLKNYSGALNYVFNAQPKNVQPFKNNKVLRKPALRLIGDFNFYYAPSQISFQTSMNRRYNEMELRNLTDSAQVYKPTYDKSFQWMRSFNLKYNFSKGLKFDYAINTNALIDETEGRVDRAYRDEYDKYKERVWNSIMELGDPLNHNQKFNASYTIPINKIPILNWVSATARYSSLYNWNRGAVLNFEDKTRDSISNSINNSQKLDFNSQLNMESLYKKVKVLDKIDKKYKQSLAQRKKPKYEDVSFEKENIAFAAGKAKQISHNLGTEEEITVTVTDNGKPVTSNFEIVNGNKIMLTTETDVETALVKVTGRREIHDNIFIVSLEQMARILMGVKQVSGSYAITNGTSIAGYKGTHSFSNMIQEPGLAFIFGNQDTNIIEQLARKGLLISDEELISPYRMSKNQVVNLKSSIEPFKSLRIDLTGKWNQTNIWSEYVFPTYDEYGNYLSHQSSNGVYTGSYSVDIWMLKTAFDPKPKTDDASSPAFEKYKENLYTMAWQYADQRVGHAPDEYNNGVYEPGIRRDTFPLGYNSTNPEVAIPAFLSAYGNYDMNGSANNLFSWQKLRPSWRIKFDGIGELAFVKKYFKNVSLTHGYNATFTVSAYTSNVLYNYDQASDKGLANMSWATGRGDSSIFVSEYDIASFAATEQFVPLLGIDLTWKNNVLTKLEYKKTRALTMSLVNNMMAEIYSWDWVIGTGYRFDNFKLKVNKKEIVSDLNLRADLSIRDGLTINHDLLKNVDEVIAGQKVFTLKITADYQLSEKLTVQLYFDHKLTDPHTTSSVYRNSITNFGFMFQFSLAQ